MALTDEGVSGIPATMLVGPASVGGSPYPVYMGGGQNSNGNGFGDNGW